MVEQGQKRNVWATSTYFYYAGLSVVTKFTIANTGCNQNSETVYLTSLSLGQFRFLTLTQYIRGLSLFHTLINRNPFHCTQQIYIVSYNYFCKLPLLYRNLIFFISASLIVQRSEPETNKMHILSFPDCNKQYHRQYIAIIMPRINHLYS